MPQGLPRKVRIAFLLQVVTVSLAVLACGWLISVVIKHGYVQNASEAEADDFFAMRASDAVFPVPQSYYIDGWFVPAGVGTEGVPDRLSALPPGYHELSKAELVRVDRRELGTLYLAYDRDRVDTLRSHLYNLRKTIDKPYDKPLLHTVQSAGYRIADIEQPPA